MKRILFYSENFCSDTVKGGLEVATFRIAKALKETGEWEIYNAFRSKSDGKEKSIYSEVIKLPHSSRAFEKKLRKFIDDNDMDIVVNMSRFFRHKVIFNATKNSQRREAKIIFMQHFAPGTEKIKPTFKSGFHLLRLNPFNPLYWFRSSVYPLIKLPRQIRYAKVYKETYDRSDKIILLSKGYISNYKRIARLLDDKKFEFIPNIFEISSDTKYSGLETEGDSKQKRVLILSRMDEIPKRMSLALQIWKKIEKNPELADWHLDIVGSGHNSDIVKKLIKKLHLKNIIYHGWQDRDPFLRQSSILMMTSAYEGLPLSIIEAQAYGVVPIAYDSFASIKDIITDEENGVLVKEFGNIDEYADKLESLMKNEATRKNLASQAMQDSRRFSSDIIVKKWQEMLENL